MTDTRKHMSHNCIADFQNISNCLAVFLSSKSDSNCYFRLLCFYSDRRVPADAARLLAIATTVLLESTLSSHSTAARNGAWPREKKVAELEANGSGYSLATNNEFPNCLSNNNVAP